MQGPLNAAWYPEAGRALAPGGSAIVCRTGLATPSSIAVTSAGASAWARSRRAASRRVWVKWLHGYGLKTHARQLPVGAQAADDGVRVGAVAAERLQEPQAALQHGRRAGEPWRDAAFRNTWL